MSLSNYLEAILLDYVFGNATFTANIEVSLSSTDPGEDGSGITEPGEASYARVIVVNDATNFPIASGTPTTKSNGADFTFPTALQDWAAGVDLTHVALYDNGGTNFLGSGVLAVARKVLINDTFVLQTGDLDITLD